MRGADVVGIDWAALDGALLLVKPKESIPEMETDFGTTSAVRADVVILDGPRAGEVLVDTLVFPKVLQSQVRPSIDGGGMVLGRLDRRRATDRPEPWTLQRATEADKKTGREHLAKTAAAPY